MEDDATHIFIFWKINWREDKNFISFSLSLSLSSRSTPSVRPSRHLSPDVFAIPNFRTSTFRNSFYLAAIYFWHSLPDPVRSSPTVGILKSRLFKHLFDLDNDPA